MAERPHSDDVSSLARRVAEQITALCPHIPAAELSDLSARLAFAELAHESGVAFDGREPETVDAPLGNRVVWLPGSSTSAIVLPAGEQEPRVAATAAQLLAWVRGIRLTARR